VEVPPDRAGAFESCCADIPVALIGTTIDVPRLEIFDGVGTILVSAELGRLKKAWQNPGHW
jgi:hypothetical protein